MRVFNKIGSKERFQEMYQNIAKLKLNEDFGQFSTNSVVETELIGLLNNDIRVNRSNSTVNGNDSFVELECLDNKGNSVKFSFKVTSTLGDQTGISNIGEILLIKFQFKGKDGITNIEANENDLRDINDKYKDKYYQLIQDYIDVKEETPIDEEFIEIGKKIDSYPFGGGSTDIQTAKSYVDAKPTNANVRVNAPELNKYIDEDVEVQSNKKEIIRQAYNNLKKIGVPKPTANQVQQEISRIKNAEISEKPIEEEMIGNSEPEIEELPKKTPIIIINPDEEMTNILLGFKPLNVGDQIE